MKHDSKFDLYMWTVGEIKDINDISTTRLADRKTIIEKEFIVNFCKDAMMPKAYESKGKNIAPVGTFTKDEDWRDEIYLGYNVDCMNAEDRKWYTACVIMDEQVEGAKVPQIKVGYRQYMKGGDKKDSRGSYFGMPEAMDELVPAHSCRVQPEGTMAQKKTADGKEIPLLENKVLVKGEAQEAAASSASTLGPNKVQDEKDMAGIKDGEIIFVAERSSCKSMKFIELID